MSEPLYETPEDLKKAIDKFIASPPTRSVKTKDAVYEVSIVTITRLCYELGFASRQSFYDQEKRSGEFSAVIQRARLYIESEYEANLSTPGCTGSIFALKNMGWDDKIIQDTNHSGVLGVRDVSEMSDEELERELNS